LKSQARGESELRRSIERHYDSLAFLYRTFWGKHIHHGLWLDGPSPPRLAQEQLVSYLADRAEVREGEEILDVGSGYGASGRWLSHRFGCRVTGVTISRKQARLARRYNERYGHAGRTQVVRANAADLPFAAGSFDLVWVVECIEHLADKRRFVRETARMLRPGGRFALCTWQRGEGIEAAEPQLREVCEAFLCPSLASAAEYRAWCEAAGLEVRCEENLTPHVRATWDILGKRIGRPWLAPLRLLVGRRVRRFVAGFPVIASAYDSGAMSYGLVVAAKLSGRN
jgi:tocopherol O-methyltransferase